MKVNDIEKDVLEFWKKDKTFEKSLEKTKNSKPYIFYDGPPFATGLPHYGHLLASTIKDLVGRFWTMQDRYVRRVWGWDCHGLPIENIAEKELGINSKEEIEKMGVKKFNSFCRSKVLTYAQEWESIVERIGRWVDFKNSYKTMDNDYIESVWWAFKQLYEKGFIYEGEKILMYCPRCATPLSKSEIAMDNSYKNVRDETITIKFKLKEKIKGEEVFVLAWTTTPWTLPSNLALTVNPKLQYVYIKDKEDGTNYLLAKNLLGNFFKSEKDYEILKEVQGQELENEEYEPLFDYFKNKENAFKILLGEFVTAEEGTGIVHTAPAFGEDDYNVCKKYNIPLAQPVDEKGHFTKEITDFEGEYIFNVNKKIIEKLKNQGKIVSIRKMEHEYPFCYRCETPLMYRAIPAWFVNIHKVKKKILKNSQEINWFPKFLKEGRVKHTIETAPDWNISRNRYWATAIPIWKSKSGKLKVIGSVEELKKYAVKLPKGKNDLHKDFLDEIKLKDEDGEIYERIPEVLDCWFESGSMTFAQFHYPFENEKFFEENFPAQFVAEYISQIRAWFYYMIALSTILFNKKPFENVVTTGTILAEDGEKMSKSKGNFPDPMKLVEKFGSDALRFYLMGSPVMNADNFNFSEKGVEEIYKKVILLLYNMNRFYKGIETKEEVEKISSKEITDKWLASRLNKFSNEVEKYLKEYNTVKACAEIRDFVDELSTWYIRINRERFNEDDEDAKKTLKFALEKTSKVIAPVIPFVSETIYQTFHGGKESVHLQKYPKKEKKIDEGLLSKMKQVREIVSLGLRERDKVQIGLKWPLAKVTVFMKGKENFEELEEIIKTQLNVKKIEFKSPDEKGTELDVELDTKLTKELESEGYAREVSRKVQAFRKELGLEKENVVELILIVDDELKETLQGQENFLKERTNSKKVEIVTTSKETFKNNTSFKIKDKKGQIMLKVIK